MDLLKFRYSTRESREKLGGMGHTKFWEEVKAGRIKVHYDGGRAYCIPQDLLDYIASCPTEPPAIGMPRSVPGAKGVQPIKPATGKTAEQRGRRKRATTKSVREAA